jgi:hypothetical protein
MKTTTLMLGFGVVGVITAGYLFWPRPVSLFPNETTHTYLLANNRLISIGSPQWNWLGRYWYHPNVWDTNTGEILFTNIKESELRPLVYVPTAALARI